jgi:hypothetical protein
MDRLRNVCEFSVLNRLNNWTILNTCTASGAQVHVYASRTFADLYFKISGFTFNGFEIRIGDQLDVQVPADLDQYR